MSDDERKNESKTETKAKKEPFRRQEHLTSKPFKNHRMFQLKAQLERRGRR